MTAGFALDMTNEHTRMMFRLMQARSALSIEINTGMKMSRGSVMSMVRTWEVCTSVTEAGDPVYTRVTWKGTKVGVWEDLDAMIVLLGGEATGIAITRKGSTDKINAAAQRRHDRRIAKLIADRPATAE